MASLDKTSVRNEVSRLKADFERLCSEAKISPESQALMTSLFMIVELMLAIFLERSTRKEAIESINIIPRDGGAIVHDCRASYLVPERKSRFSGKKPHKRT